MRIDEIRNLTNEDLQEERERSHKEKMNLRFQHATRQLTNTSQFKVARRKLARINTVIRERKADQE
jgi:large subunit ribosomal protein L29